MGNPNYNSLRQGDKVMTDEKDREIWVSGNRFYLGENNILYETIVGEQTDSMAAEMLKVVEKLYSSVDGKVKILIDLDKAGKTTSGARKIGQKAFENEKLQHSQQGGG